MSVDDDFYTLDADQKRWVMDRIYSYRKNLDAAYASFDPDKAREAQEDLKAFLIQRAKQDKNGNGPEKWHDALTRYTELERRVAELERVVRGYIIKKRPPENLEQPEVQEDDYRYGR